MARATSSDPFSINRFHVTDTNSVLGSAASFNSVTMPEISVEMVEYKEGTELYRRKFPGETTFAPITMTRGVIKNNSALLEWILAASQNKAYRTDIQIKVFHRDDVSGLVDYKLKTAERTITLKEALPTRVKLGGDLDAMASEIMIEEIDVEYESFSVKDKGSTTEVVAKTIG